MSVRSRISNFVCALKDLLQNDSDLRTEEDWNAPLFTPIGFIRKLPIRFNWVVCLMIFIGCIFVLAAFQLIWRLLRYLF